MRLLSNTDLTRTKTKTLESIQMFCEHVIQSTFTLNSLDFALFSSRTQNLFNFHSISLCGI